MNKLNEKLHDKFSVYMHNELNKKIQIGLYTELDNLLDKDSFFDLLNELKL